MSRIIIKNLPTYITPQRLRSHFSENNGPGGIITDVQIALKPDGTSRRFGFIGYKTDEEAKTAKEWFDRTFVGSTKINVEVVEGAKDAPLPRPNKRPKLGPSQAEVKLPTARNLQKSGPEVEKPKENSSQLAEFMEVMKPRPRKGPSWTNEDITAVKIPRNLNPAREKPDISDIAVEEPLGKDAEVSDLEWMKRRMKSNIDNVDMGQTEGRAFEQSDDDVEEERNPPPPPLAAETNADDADDATTKSILSTGRLFLRNLAFSCTDADLLNLFMPFGDVAKVHIPLDALTQQSKGLAYVTYAQPACALAAYESLDKKSFQGRLLHILPAVDRTSKSLVEDGDGKKKTVKDDRSAKRKATAGKDFNWGMLYMNSDAVLSSVADRMNIAKADILNPEADNAAVRLALAETHIINETKAYLESQGIILTAFSSRARSDTTILVKNIPYGTSAAQIRELFEPHGELDRVVVPPAGTMAVVEFLRAGDARKAFQAVAYRRMGNSVVYLEKGPIGMFREVNEVDDSPHGDEPKVSFGVAPVTIPDQEDVDEAQAISEGTTLFVKNLSFATTTERLTQVLRTVPGFSFARVQTKPDPKHREAGAPRLSMGYGFVGFKTVEAAKRSLKSLDGHVLDGHALRVKFAGRGKAEESKSTVKEAAKSKTTKMVVKNLPFEATKKDVRELFSAHGNLKSVRVPKKFDSRSRGFAFLEFLTRREAENAYTSLQHTHLLGRHLVLEWAEETEVDLDALRQRTGVGFGGGDELPGRKRKLDMGEKEVVDETV